MLNNVEIFYNSKLHKLKIKVLTKPFYNAFLITFKNLRK